MMQTMILYMYIYVCVSITSQVEDETLGGTFSHERLSGDTMQSDGQEQTPKSQQPATTIKHNPRTNSNQQPAIDNQTHQKETNQQLTKLF